MTCGAIILSPRLSPTPVFQWVYPRGQWRWRNHHCKCVLAAQTNTDDNIVDWVFIELRDANNSATVVETQSALLQRDGNVVDAADGVSNVCFSGLASPTVFVSVRHRNHLGAMAASAVTLTNAGATVFSHLPAGVIWLPFKQMVYKSMFVL